MELLVGMAVASFQTATSLLMVEELYDGFTTIEETLTWTPPDAQV
jgi:hypothetical protein